MHNIGKIIFDLGYNLAVWSMEALGDFSFLYLQHVVHNFYYALPFGFFIQVKEDKKSFCRCNKKKFF